MASRMHLGGSLGLLSKYRLILKSRVCLLGPVISALLLLLVLLLFCLEVSGTALP